MQAYSFSEQYNCILRIYTFSCFIIRVLCMYVLCISLSSVISLLFLFAVCHFYSRRMIGGGRRLVPEMLGQTDPIPRKNADFIWIFTRSASDVAPSEKC